MQNTEPEKKNVPTAANDTAPIKELGKVNVIVTCPKSFRCFEPASGKMYYERDLLGLGIVMTPHGRLAHILTGQPVTSMFPLWNTSQHDEAGQPLYEGDICEIGVDTGFGSLNERVGIMRWDVDRNCFSLHFNGRGSYEGGVIIKACRKIGNEFQDIEAGLRYKKDNE